MNNSSLVLRLQDPAQHFSPTRCREVGFLAEEALFLKDLFLSDGRDNAWVFQNFGGGRAYHLLQLGLVENPLGQIGSTQTNIWKLTPQGMDVLSRLAGLEE